MSACAGPRWGGLNVRGRVVVSVTRRCGHAELVVVPDAQPGQKNAMRRESGLPCLHCTDPENEAVEQQ